MKKAVPVFLFAVLIVVFGFQVRSADAYSTYSTNRTTGNCATCHGDFTSSPYTPPLEGGLSWGDSLHNVHRNTMLSGDCNTCHSSGGRTPVILDSSVGGSGLSPISCVGCHGRTQDGGNDSASGGLGAGLRQHHTNAGINTCAGCHTDANPANYTPVGENVLPPYYGNSLVAHPNMPTNPCNLDGNENFAGGSEGLDNDGDGVYDGADSDCQAATAPQIDVTPASPYDFGSVTVGSSASQEFTISNKGTADLHISNGVLSDETNFAVDGNSGSSPCGELPVTITPDNNCTVSIAFSPQDAITYTATVTISSDDPVNPSLVVDLSGSGVTGPAPGIQVSPTSVDFGEVNVGDTPATEVTISNTGNDNLVVTNIALDNTDVYSIDTAGGTNPCGSTTPTINPNDNCTVDVVFTPIEDGGPFTATMTITSNVPDVNVPLTGTGFLDTDGDGVGDSVDDYPDDPTKATPVAATGGAGKILVDATPNTLSGVAAVVLSPGQAVSGFTFPDGLVTFQVTVAAPGDNAVVTLVFPSGTPSNGKYFKDDGSGTLVEFAGATINTDNVVLMLTDGGSGDNDNTADGVITDPGGLATPVSSGGGGGGGGCSIIGQGSTGFGTAAVIFLTLLAILVALRQRGARARR